MPQLVTVAAAAGILIGCTWWLSALSHRSAVEGDVAPTASATPSDAVSPAGVDDGAGSPAGAVRAYYADLNAKAYPSAYALLSSAERQRRPFSA